MNKMRRELLEGAKEALADLMAVIQQHANKEREAFDNMPEGLQASERGEKTDTAASELENAAQFIDDAIQAIDEAIS